MRSFNAAGCFGVRSDISSLPYSTHNSILFELQCDPNASGRAIALVIGHPRKRPNSLAVPSKPVGSVHLVAHREADRAGIRPRQKRRPIRSCWTAVVGEVISIQSEFVGAVAHSRASTVLVVSV